MPSRIPNVIALNLHRRFTGISATVRTLVPIQRREVEIGLVDSGGLDVGGKIGLLHVALQGFRKPADAEFRVWHARRDVDMIVGIILRDLFRQRWRLIFTSAARKRPGRTLNFLIRRMDAVIATSKRSAGFLDWHSVVIPHGVDTGFFCPEADAADADRNSDRGFAITTAGRVRRSKGTDLFVDAMIRLLPRHPGFRAYVIGECRPDHAEFQRSLRLRIEEAGLDDRIRFVGQVGREEMRGWYRKTDLFVAPSRSEGFGLTVLEAFACGTPAVAASIGAWPWIVREGTGSIFEAGRLDDLAAELDPLLSDPGTLAEMGRNARAHAVECHSVESEANEINALYKRLMRGEILPRLEPSGNADS